MFDIIRSMALARWTDAPASREQVVAVIILMKDLFPDRRDRIYALRALFDDHSIHSTNDLTSSQAHALISVSHDPGFDTFIKELIW